MKIPDRSIYYWHFWNIPPANHAPPQTEMSGFLSRFFFLFLFPTSHLSLPIHPHLLLQNMLFLEVQQQPLVELSRCFNLHTVVQKTPSILSIKRQICPCVYYYHTCMLCLQVRDENMTLNVQMLCFVMVILANFSS